jgi:hypothetical protein
VLANNHVYPTTSSLSKMGYCVILIPLNVCDVLLGKPYLWKRHVVYESRPCSVIITLGRQLYRMLEVAIPTAISLIFSQQCSEAISQTEKLFFFAICSHSKKKASPHFWPLHKASICSRSK